MSKIADKLIEVEELLRAGFSVDDVAKIAGVPADWVIDVDLELSGMHQYDDSGYEEQNG